VSNLVSLLVSLPLLLGLLGWYGRLPGASLLVLPVLLAVQCVLIVGIGLAVATLNVFYRDVQHLVTTALMVLFYVTPVFYRPGEVGEGMRWLFVLSPIAVLVEAYRAVFFEGTWPAGGPLLLAAVLSGGLGGLALLVYRAQRHELVDAL
jgi:ABC-type polysaccharide/polyol phosphate export permease